MPFAQTVYWILEIPESLKSWFSLFCAVSHLSNCINRLADSFNSGPPEMLIFHHKFKDFLGFVIIIWSKPNADLSNRYSTFCEIRGRRRGGFQPPGWCPFSWFLIIIFKVLDHHLWPSLSIWLNARFCETVHTNPPGTRNKKMPHVRISRTIGTNQWSRDSGDHLMPPCGPQEWQNPLDCCSNFKIEDNEAWCDGWWRKR